MKITSPLTEILIKEVLICAKNNSLSLHHQKITPAFTSSPLNFHLNTIETVTTPFIHLYTSNQTLLLPNTRVKLHTSFSIVHFHKTKALNPGDNQSILETDIDIFFPPRTCSDVLSLLLHTYPHAHTTTVHAHGMETYIMPL